jgi:tRNA (mo5U34)-methyltransferase
MGLHPPDVVEFVRSVNESGGVYHRIDFGDGLVMEGEHDMGRYLAYYGIPPDLSGMTVLDVGTAAGYFSVEFARRGADVTAIDLWDGSFQRMVFRAAGVDVRYVEKDLFELDESFGRFDLVFCGSVLVHIWDQFTAMRRLRSVCGGQAIIATTISRAGFRGRPLAAFVGGEGEGAGGREYWTTWEPNPPALVEMAKKAGFGHVTYRGWFWLAGNPPVRHGVLHAWTGSPPRSSRLRRRLLFRSRIRRR